MLRLDQVQILNLIEEIPLVFRRHPEGFGFDQDLQKNEQEMQILIGRWQNKRVDGKRLFLEANRQIRTATKTRQVFVTAADVKDGRERSVLLKMHEQEIRKEAFAGSCFSSQERMRNILVMQVQEIWRLK